MNEYNGVFLRYNIDQSLYENIKKKFKTNGIYLYKNKNTYPEIYKPNENYIIPIGLFSNNDFVLKCNWRKTTRVFFHDIKNITCNIKLTEVQEKIIQEYEKNVETIKNINKAPIYLNLVGECSIGKTVLAIYIINLFKVKTFVITPSLELTKQWKREIMKFLPNIRCYESLNGVKGLLKLKQEELLSYDIICAPFKHLSNEDFNILLLNNFSFGIIDEQHVYNLETNDVLQKFLTFYSFPLFLSLTATARHINSFYLGKEINLDNIINEYKPKTYKKTAYEVTLASIGYNVKLLKTDDIMTTYYTSYKNLKKKNINTKQDILILSNYKKRSVSHDPIRIEFICKEIVKSFLCNTCIKHPKIIILTKFVEEIQMYYDRLLLSINSSKQDIFPIYASKKNTSSLSEIKKTLETKDSYILIGTEDHLGTGIDIVELNILHLVSIPTNRRNIIQYAGRVSRDNSTDTHNIYYYNINSYNKDHLNIDNEINIIRKTLMNKNWNCVLIKIEH